MSTFHLLEIADHVFFPSLKYNMELSGLDELQTIQAALKGTEKILIVPIIKDGEKTISSAKRGAVGAICRIDGFVQNGSEKANVSMTGLFRAEIKSVTNKDGVRMATVNIHEQNELKGVIPPDIIKTAGRVRTMFREISKFEPRTASAALTILGKMVPEDELCDTVTSLCVNSNLKRLEILREMDLLKRLELLCECLAAELENIKCVKNVADQAKTNIEKQQREYYLREQLKVIGEELGDDASEHAQMMDKLEKSGMPDDAREKTKKEIKRLLKTNPTSPEITILRNWIENMLDLPWDKSSDDETSLKKARARLDADHYGMEDVKQRIIEHIAVMQLNKNLTGQILCLVGSPGVGKTSIVESVASALGRSFVRVSLGGIKDESEIRGHRKTYVGAMPGKIISGMKRAGTVNPVFLLDEIDKMAHDVKGDPASAMLEVLDPVQNKTFSDHYMEVPYDLSHVLFICTANDETQIPWALQDRMEIINLASYTLVEKKKIATQFLFPKISAEHGIDKTIFKIPSDKAMAFLIERYTREAGVRELARVIGALMRKVAVDIVDGTLKKTTKLDITVDFIASALGKEKYSKKDHDKNNSIGIVNGLSYTTVGGDVLQLEVALTPGKGELKLTGNLGNVMKESATLALSVAKTMADKYKIPMEKFEKNDIHIHVPGGAVPKDGPSAGAALVVALISSFAEREVRGNYALTGEVTLSGRVLEIGGVREKVMSAYRYGIDNVVLPCQNQKNLEKVPTEVVEKLNFKFLSTISDVLSTMLV